MNGDRFPAFLEPPDEEPTAPTHTCVPGCVCHQVRAAARRLRGSVRFLELAPDQDAVVVELRPRRR